MRVRTNFDFIKSNYWIEFEHDFVRTTPLLKTGFLGVRFETLRFFCSTDNRMNFDKTRNDLGLKFEIICVWRCVFLCGDHYFRARFSPLLLVTVCERKSKKKKKKGNMSLCRNPSKNILAILSGYIRIPRARYISTRQLRV